MTTAQIKILPLLLEGQHPKKARNDKILTHMSVFYCMRPENLLKITETFLRI